MSRTQVLKPAHAAPGQTWKMARLHTETTGKASRAKRQGRRPEVNQKDSGSIESDPIDVRNAVLTFGDNSKDEQVRVWHAAGKKLE